MLKKNFERSNKIYLAFTALLFSLCLIFGWGVIQYQEHSFSVYFFNVGQGDSALINDKNTQILIDGGPNNSVIQELSKVLPFYDRNIEFMILSHSHSDHMSGLIDVLRRYHVNKIVMPKINHDLLSGSAGYAEFLQAASDNGSEVSYASPNQTIEIGSNAIGSLIWPPQNFESKDLNDYSILFRFDYGAVCFLFTGDGDETIQKNPQLSDNIKECQIIKVPHHGSKTALDDGFLNKINPEIAIISVGKNSYGHPSPVTIGKLKNYGIDILRTDEMGTIQITSDGVSYEVIR